MLTYIIVGVCICFTLALSARDIFRSRNLHGATSEEWLRHQYDYELSFTLLFKKLRLGFLGSLGSLLVFLALIPFMLGLLASVADGTLFLPGDAIGFFEDYRTLALIVVGAASIYIFRKVMDMVPETLHSIPNDTTDDLSKAQHHAHKIECCLKRVASVLFQTNGGRGRWGRALDVGLTILLASIVAISWASSVNNPPEIVDWKNPDYLWGNMFGIIYYSFIFFYILRICLGYLIRLVWCLWYLGKKLDEGNLLRIEPLNPDGAGGLGEFGKLGWRIDLVPLPPLMMAVYWYIFFPITAVFISGLIITILLVPVFFFGSLWGLHKAMAKAKSKALNDLSQQYNRNASIIKRLLNSEESVTIEKGLAAQEVLERVILLYERTSRMPVWPFDHTTLTRVFGYFLLPIIAILLQNVL